LYISLAKRFTQRNRYACFEMNSADVKIVFRVYIYLTVHGGGAFGGIW